MYTGFTVLTLRPAIGRRPHWIITAMCFPLFWRQQCPWWGPTTFWGKLWVGICQEMAVSLPLTLSLWLPHQTSDALGSQTRPPAALFTGCSTGLCSSTSRRSTSARALSGTSLTSPVHRLEGCNSKQASTYARSLLIILWDHIYVRTTIQQ